MKRITIYTDGACSGNPGIGGWAALVINGDKEYELSGGEKHTTNNRMELLAAIAALRSVEEACIVDLYTDSQYVKKGITEWIKNWQTKGWKTTARKPVKNIELWKELLEVERRHQVSWHWVEGHSGDELNDRVDRLARERCQKS